MFKALDKESAKRVVEILEREYKDAKYYLNFSTPIDLLVAAILSAQTKDTVVNEVTPALFAKYKTAHDYAVASLEDIIEIVRPVSFAGNKAKNIIAACKIIEKQYNGKVPSSMSQLLELPGVGRKTANTILINAYGIVEGIPVDTWVIKLAYRIGLSGNKDPDKIEQDLMQIVDKKYWHNFAYVLKSHGKAVCQSTVPICSKCVIGPNGSNICPRNGVVKSN
ncbi:MAG: endonuclease III domain-containing protein [Candidatus Micrarchaeia archaeon]